MGLPKNLTQVEVKRPDLARLREIRRKISAERNYDARTSDVIEYLLDEYNERNEVGSVV